MIDILDNKKGYIVLILIHLLLGVMLKFAPIIVALAYPVMLFQIGRAHV